MGNVIAYTISEGKICGTISFKFEVFDPMYYVQSKQ